MEKIKMTIQELLASYLNVSKEQILFTTPPSSELGDLALPCFTFAKSLRKSPILISEDIQEFLVTQDYDFISHIETKQGYVNIYFNKTYITQHTIEAIQDKKDFYGSNQLGIGKEALIEHTSINPNASPHIGRARNALIGDVISRLLKFEGFSVDTQYFVNDIGKQIAMLVYAASDLESIEFKDLLKLYVDINNTIKENPELENEIFDLLSRFESGEELIVKAFKKIVDVCIEGQTGLLSELGIHYDTFKYESDYIFSHRLLDILEAFKQTPYLEEDESGRYVLNLSKYELPMKAPYLVLTRKDKTSLYVLRDIAYTIDKIKQNPHHNFILLGEDQKLYFKQLSAALDILGYPSPKAIHYSFVLLKEGKMATREGKVVLLEDFMKEAVVKVETYVTESNHTIADKKTIKAIAYGAVKYAILKVDNDRNVTFNWDHALSFEGDSGPYIQYSYARIQSILKKVPTIESDRVDYSLLDSLEEYELVKHLNQMSEIIKKSLEEKSPHLLAQYAYQTAKKFSSFYHHCPIMTADSEKLKHSRLALIQCVAQVIKNTLSILGIDVVDSM
ncbi:arginine--tRNA ligase [Vallitalea okinawensis]|uniref:arginine--tRNA ligase n=1 Tax=Vallitalea okinawensis TaxID=2078660 RepID=UPI000CFDCC87|nr:arginine--tRNA ligase [Vallitalea okinawensis]